MMIEINLLPEELKVKAAKIAEREKYKRLLSVAPLIIGLLLIAHIFLGIIGLSGNVQLNILRQKLSQLQPQKQMLENFKNQYTGISAEAGMIQELVSKRINWAQKLNRLSLDLPSGVWLNELSVTPRSMVIRGSVVSQQKEEARLITKFTDNLRKDADVFEDFSNLDIESEARETIGTCEIVNFVLNGNLKAR